MGELGWWCITFIPALRRQKQLDLREFKALLVSIEISKLARAR